MLMDTSSLDSEGCAPADASGTEFRTRPMLRVDVSALSMMDQVLVRKYLRQLSARHDVEWLATSGRDAEAAIDYRGEQVRIVAGGLEELLLHPIRITQMDSVLARIARQCATRTAGRHAVLPATLSALLMPQHKYPGPLRVVGNSFGVLYFDRSYRHAWSAMAAGDLHQALSRSQNFDRVEAVAARELDGLIGSGGVQPVSVESLCWSIDNRAALAQAGDRFEGEDGLVRLTSWPNLAWQPDFEDWLPVLISATAPIPYDELRRRLVAQGVEPARAAEKLHLLAVFGRLERATGARRAAPVAAPSAPASMFGRLRSRLRAMLTA